MRLYPPFAAAVLGSALLYDLVRPRAIPLLGSWFNKSCWQLPPTASVIAGHLALTDRVDLQGLDNVMWSLVHEARISVIFPLIAFCVWKNWYVTAIASLIISVASRHIDQSLAPGWPYDPFATLKYVFLFAGGAALSLKAETVRRWLRGAPPWARAALWASALAFITFPTSPRLGVIATFSALLLVALCFADPRVDAILSHRFPTWLGRISYSLYLIHLPVLLALVHLFWAKVALQYILLCALLLSLLIADLAYRIVEKPSIDLGRRLALLFKTPLSLRQPAE
jgi:peptidoglycan/LPS O-acetylase OafA/YrhL